MHPLLIEFGSWGLPAYGALVAVGYLAGILWLKSQIRFLKLTEDDFWLLIYLLFFGAVAGGKILYVAVEYRAFLSGEIHFFRDFRYGFIFFGGFFGVLLMGLVAQRRLKLDYLAAADYFSVALPLGHAIGRLGCLAAGCCYGKPTSLPWGLALGGHPASTTPEALWGRALHPTQIYESLGNFGIFLFLLYCVLPRIQKGKIAEGTAFFGYIALYSVLRFGVEMFRGDERGLLAGLATSQWISLAAAAVAGALILKRGVYRHGK